MLPQYTFSCIKTKIINNSKAPVLKLPDTGSKLKFLVHVFDKFITNTTATISNF